MFRYLLLALGVLLSLPLLVLVLLLPRTPVSPVGALYLLSYVLIVVGMIFAPWQGGRSSILILAGSTLVFIIILVRILFPPTGTNVNLITLPGPSGPRVLNRLVDEQDIVLFGARVSPYLGTVSASEKQSLDLKFSRAFRNRNAEGVTPLSPFLSTYLYQQHPNGFDTVVAEPTSGIPPAAGIIFLHGFGGNFTLQCWLIATAGDAIHAITVCPSTDPSGAW